MHILDLISGTFDLEVECELENVLLAVCAGWEQITSVRQ